MYAGRKRRKAVPRVVRPCPAEGGTSNPSKRHRERLNRELERLAGLLPFPQEVVAGLDKLSVLRLSAGYLRAKSFFSVALKNHSAKEEERDEDYGKGPAPGSAVVPEGELLLQALNGFVLVVTSEGLIFYSSHTIQDYLGFHQTDVMHQSVFELIHTEDQQEFRRNLHWALKPPHASKGELSPEEGKSVGSCAVTYKLDQLPPENSSFLERSFVCRFRCLLDNSSGFLALNLQGRLKFLHGQNKKSEDGSVLPPQLALFAISTPLQPPSILQIRTKNMIFRTKHKLDFTPLACDAKGKIVLGYTEAELRMRGTGYQFIHAADMLYCAENHVRMMKTGESGLTVFRLLTKENRWKWVQANARLVYKSGQPEYIIVTQRPLLDEEGGEHLRKRSMHLPFTFATGEALLYHSAYPLPAFPDPFQNKGKTSKSKKTSHNHGGRSQKNGVNSSSLLGTMMQQDKTVYASQPALPSDHSFSSSFVEHLKDVSLLDAENDAWSMGAAPVASKGDSLKEELVDLQQEDPLLATLDSLSIKNDESCSNNELFSALEGLGLNAEDLELLLLDEKMVMVNMDPDHTPSLNDCLTSNEIFSYIHTTLVSKQEGGQQVCPLPGTSMSPHGGTSTYQVHAENEDSQYMPQYVLQPGITLGQLPASLWEQPLHSVPGKPHLMLPELTEEEPADSSQWRPAGGEGLLHFLQPVQGIPWDKVPSSSPGAPCLQEPLRTQQLEGDFPALYATQDNAHWCLSRPNQCQGHVGPPSQPKHHHLQKNGLCSHSPDSTPHYLSSSSPSPWQDYVSPLLGSLPQPVFSGITQDLISQHQGCWGTGPGMPAMHFNLNGVCSMETASSGESQEKMAPYSSFSTPSSYQLIPEKQLSTVMSVPQHLSAEGCFGSISSPPGTPVSSYGTYASMLSQGSRHRPADGCVLPSSPLGLPRDHLLLESSLAPSCQPQPPAEALPDHPHASSSDFCL
ncbi:aryl hydrocarbon receptor-like [Indicator indicator]|uniref:aryl hydrocarbon receptor-like n=1 Tax=Indicator indicator TaxID=1002788 RepID=UPI0023DEB140|nr:aryl hydrocarbon receptor-like [Indicator indicator]